MRVCYLLQKTKQTGARSVGERLGYALTEAGHDVMFMVPNPIDIDHSDPFVLDGNVHVPTVDLVSAVSIADPDVLIAHTANQELVEAMPLINSMTTTLFRCGVNLVESHVNGNTGHVQYYPKFIRSFDAILAPSDHAVSKVIGMGVDRERIYVVRPPMSLDPEEPDLSERAHQVGVVARHSRIKNLPMLARAIRFYEDEFGDAPRVLVGGGKSDYEEPLLIEHARGLSIDHKFDLLGWVNPYEAIYSKVKATVLPSLSEHFPAVYGEALSAGVPVLAPEAGWSIPPAVYSADDLGALALELKHILEDPATVHAAQMEAAPDGIAMEAAVKDLEKAVVETHERCDRFTLGAAV
jgi:glycosyltransferase involved in cell wall biosynthesis